MPRGGRRGTRAAGGDGSWGGGSSADARLDGLEDGRVDDEARGDGDDVTVADLDRVFFGRDDGVEALRRLADPREVRVRVAMMIGKRHRAGGLHRPEKLFVVGKAGESEEFSLRDVDLEPPRNDEVGVAQRRASLAKPLAGGVDHDVDF